MKRAERLVRAGIFGLFAGAMLANAKDRTLAVEGGQLDNPKPSLDAIDYSLGVALTSSPTHLGSRQQKLEPRLLGSLEWGPFSLSGVGQGSMLRTNRADAPATGLSTRFRLVDDLNTSLGLRLDGGRRAFSHPKWGEIDAVPRHLRYVITASYAFSPRYSAQLSYSGAFQPERHGSTATLGWTFSPPPTGWGAWQSSLNLSWADSTYMRNRFGLSSPNAPVTYVPVAGLRDLSWSTILSYRLSSHWSLLAGFTATRYWGNAARSPLLDTRQQYYAQLGLVYQHRASRR